MDQRTIRYIAGLLLLIGSSLVLFVFGVTGFVFWKILQMFLIS